MIGEKFFFRARAEAVRRAASIAVAAALWQPYPNSPQQQAVESQAFIVGYGGAAGGGKTDTQLGIAALGHRKATIFRREYDQLDDIIERAHELLDDVGDYNKSTRVWRGSWMGADGKIASRRIHFAAINDPRLLLKKWRGRTRDFLGIDEATEWPEMMVRFLMGWLRTTIPGQRCRVVLTFNPPTSAEGMWVIEFFAPWLDPQHPNPARAGEIRWFVRKGEKDEEVPGPEPIEHEGELLYPQSRTFIPAKLADNPVLAATSYGATLSALPEPLRSQLRNGDFRAGIKDDDWQLIPTRWVEEAMRRWEQTPRPRDERGVEVPLIALGVDPSRGGAAKFVIAPRYDHWFGHVIAHQGKVTDNGDKGRDLVLAEWENGAVINLDLTGIGTSVFDSLRTYAIKLEEETDLRMQVNAINSAKTSKRRDKSGKYRLVNVRAAMWWTMMEALDPANGSRICLPPDPELKADLCAPRYKITTEGIMIEPKYSQPNGVKGIAERLGRSPDKGDAVVLARWSGVVAIVG